MKKGIVVAVRQGQDKEKKNNVLYVTIARLPSKMQNGNLWFPKNAETLITACFNFAYSPDQYNRHKDLPIGSLVEISSAINEYTDKPFVQDLKVIAKSPFTEEQLF